jgi:hypothetical protein
MDRLISAPVTQKGLNVIRDFAITWTTFKRDDDDNVRAKFRRLTCPLPLSTRLDWFHSRQLHLISAHVHPVLIIIICFVLRMPRAPLN